jgi:hypothetical protein
MEVINLRMGCIQKTICLKLNLKIRGGADFIASLIVLDSKGIDVILGID